MIIFFIEHHSSIWQEEYIKKQQREIMALDFSIYTDTAQTYWCPLWSRLHSHPFISHASKVALLEANFTGMGLDMKQL